MSKWLTAIVVGPVGRHIVTLLLGAAFALVIADPTVADACRDAVLQGLSAW